MPYRLKADLDARISSTTLPNRARRWLQAAGIETVRDLLERTEEDLLTINNFAFTSLQAVKQYLADRGLSLAPSRSEPCPSEWIEQVLTDSELELEAREREVLKYRHGIQADMLTLEDAGQRLQLTRERVRQIQKKAENKVMAYMIFQRKASLPDGGKPNRRGAADRIRAERRTEPVS